MISKKITIITVMILLAAGGAYVANAAGIFLFGGNGYQDISAASTQAGLIGYWPLDGDNYNSATGRVTDKTPYEHHGNNNGATLTTDRMGQSNGAMNFNGSSWIDTGTVFPSINALMTISIWVNPGTSQTTYADIWGNHANYDGIVMQQNADNLNQYSFGYGNGSSWIGTGFFNLTANQWQHVVAVKDSQNCYIYINGVEQISARVSCPSNIVPSTGPNFRIAQGFSSGRYFNGSISDVRVYNRALSATEVSTLYGSYKPKIVSDSLQKGLILDMPLTSKYTKTVTAGSEIMVDRTPYSNNGQNSGAAIGSDSANFVEESDVVAVPGAFLNNLSKITESVWINPSVLCEGSRTDWDIFLSRADPWGYMGFYRSGSNFIPDFYLALSNGSRRVSASISVSTNQWYHVAGVYDGSKMKIYINGVESNNIDASGVTATTGDSLAIGDYHVGYHDVSPNAKMSSVKIYNRALAADEIKLLYDRGR